ncbi:MAG: hypothetical protein GX208_01595 [Firmicutes bacterium]|nr:hypothetical protein [Bacillota bacterium]
MKNYRVDWNLGGIIIFLSLLVAIVSLFMTWIDLGPMTWNGLDQKGYISLLFWIYPLVRLFQNKKIHSIIGIISAAAAIALVLFFLTDLSVDFYVVEFNVTGIGVYVFVVAAIALALGVIMYQKK